MSSSENEHVAGHEPGVDTGYAPPRWEFDDEVTRVFDDMLRRSIPQYDVMRRSVFDIGSRFVVRGSWIVDLGAARGEALQPFIEQFGALNRFCAVEISPPMLDALRKRYETILISKESFASGIVDVRSMDLRNEYPPVKASLVLSILTLQFTPIEYRTKIVRRIFDSLLPGGALILVEKVLGSSALLSDTLVALYHARKRDAGYTADEIERKRLALEGVLVPVTARWNEELLHEAGFKTVECFWRWMNFAAWIAVRE